MNEVSKIPKIIAKALIKIVVTILVIAAVIILLDYLGLVSFYFFSKNNYSIFIEIPDLDKGYVPQGMCYTKDNLVLQTAYNDNGPSKLYVIDYEKKELSKGLILKNSKNEEIRNHVGGIASDEELVWICGDHKLFMYSLPSIISSTENFISSTKEFDIPNGGDFCFYQYNKMNDNPNDLHYYKILWIGEFSVNVNPLKKYNQPYLYGYDLEKSTDISNFDNPDYITTLPNTVQGLFIDNNNHFIFSRSYSGFLTSNIDIYENMLDTKTEEMLINGNRKQYHDYKNTRRIANYTLPPMSEGFFIKDDNIYVVFESATKKYLYAVPKLKHIISFKLKQ